MNAARAPSVENLKDESKRGTTEDSPYILSGVPEGPKAGGRGLPKRTGGKSVGGSHRPRNSACSQQQTTKHQHS